MPLDNVRNIVLILSGKGGVGKSSITTQVALSLSLAGHSVGILDVDLTGPSIPRLFGLESAKITQAPGGWLPVRVHESQILEPIHSPPPPATKTTNGAATKQTSSNTNGATITQAPALLTSDGASTPIGSLHLMSLGFLLPSRSSAVVWRGPKKTAMVRQFLTDVLWPPIDYLLIDTPPGTSDEHISLAEQLLKVASPGNKSHLAGAVVVTTPQAISTADVRKELNFCKKVGINVIGVVENMSGYVCECCGVGTNLFGKGGGEVMSRDFGVRFLGGVPVDGQWGVLVEEGRRPVYRSLVRERGDGDGDGDGDGEDVDADVDRDGEGKERVKEGLLVDKYRSCSLSGLFEGIAREVVQIVEHGKSAS